MKRLGDELIASAATKVIEAKKNPIEYPEQAKRVKATVKGSKAQLRDYQTRICSKVLGYYSEGVKSVLVEAPTGSGKTVMAMIIAKAVQVEKGCKVGIVTARRELLRQAAACNNDMGFDIEDLETISMFANADNIPTDIDMLIVDEAHRDACNTMSVVHSTIKPKLILGLTATPFRADKVGLSFERVVKDANIYELVRQGYLAHFDHYTVDSWNPEHLADVYLADPERWGKSIFFFHQMEHCRILADRLTAAGVRCEIVRGGTGKIRERQIEEFKNPDSGLNVLINMMVLTEGFDYPALKTVWVRPSVKGCTTQMGGRVFRIDEMTGRKQVVQCKETKWPFTRLAPATGQYLWQDQKWLSLVVNEKIDEIANDMAKKIARVDWQSEEQVRMMSLFNKLGQKKRRWV